MQNGHAYGQAMDPFKSTSGGMTGGTTSLSNAKVAQSALAGFESRLDVLLKQVGEATSRLCSMGNRLVGADPPNDIASASPEPISQLDRIAQRLSWLDSACVQLHHEIGRLDLL